MDKKDDEIIKILDSFNDKGEEIVRCQAKFVEFEDKKDIDGMKETLKEYDKILEELISIKNTLIEVANTIKNDTKWYLKPTMVYTLAVIKKLVNSNTTFELFSEFCHKMLEGSN